MGAGRDPEPERRTCEIRLGAERKAGKLLARMEKAKGTAGAGRPRKGGRTKLPPNSTPTLSELSVSKTQSARWQQLASVPEEQFEAALAAPEKPSTNGIIQSRPKQEPMCPKALWLWGRLRDFERDGLLDEDPRDLLSRMTDGMRADVRRLSTIVGDWLRSMDDRCEDATSSLQAEEVY